MQDTLQDGDLDVTFSPADADTILPLIKDKLFFFTLQDAVAGLPKSVHHELAASFGLEPEDLPPADCDCTACPDQMGKNVIGFQHPVLTKKVSPRFSDEAIRQNITAATTEVAFQLTAQAEKRNIWLLLAAPAKLDVMSANAIEQYQFSPATCHDVPKASTIIIRVTFKRY